MSRSERDFARAKLAGFLSCVVALSCDQPTDPGVGGRFQGYLHIVGSVTLDGAPQEGVTVD